jgi:hypothetical protein
MLDLNKHLLVLIILVIWGYSCKKENSLTVPEIIVDKKMTKLISGDEAMKIVNKLHGLSVAPEKNRIAEYGKDPKDLLYISWYSLEDQARESFNLMIQKMKESESGPFTHLRALPDYEQDVYMSIGMGAIHYIYRSKHCILWLQTFQEIGRELPENLLELYPL